MKKLFLLIPALMLGSLQANDWRFSVSLGTGSIDYEEDAFFKDADNNPDVVRGVQLQSKRSDTYTPSIYGIGLGNGKHTFGYKVTSASSSDYDLVSNLEASTYTTTIRERDYEETTISYQYRLNSDWTVGVAYNDKEHERNTSNFKNYPITWDGENSEYTWTNVGKSNSTQDGLAVYATWQKLFANHWVFAAKLGVSQTDLDEEFNSVGTLTGVPVSLNDIYIEAGIGALNGSTFTNAGMNSGDSTTAYGGLSLIRIFPSAPNHQIIFSIDARTDDLAGTSVLTVDNVATGYFANPDRNPETEEPTPTGGSDIEEYNLKYTLEYKYTF
jgi:hypothetical protein